MLIQKALILSFILMMMESCQQVVPSKPVLENLKGKNGFTFKASQSKWLELKKNNGDSYSYLTSFTSWSGLGNKTEIIVKNGTVTGRIYEEYQTMEHAESGENAENYYESQAELGSHKKGADLLTLDELYASCSNTYLMANPEENTLYFETDKSGILTLCGYVPNNCADDCFTGVRIDSLQWL